MPELLSFVGQIIWLYTYVIVADIILSWLMQLNIVNPYQPTVRSLAQGLHAVTEPLLRPIRRYLPASGGIDWSPLVLILICLFLVEVVIPNLARHV